MSENSSSSSSAFDIFLPQDIIKYIDSFDFEKLDHNAVRNLATVSINFRYKVCNTGEFVYVKDEMNVQPQELMTPQVCNEDYEKFSTPSNPRPKLILDVDYPITITMLRDKTVWTYSLPPFSFLSKEYKLQSLRDSVNSIYSIQFKSGWKFYMDVNPVSLEMTHLKLTCDDTTHPVITMVGKRLKYWSLINRQIEIKNELANLKKEFKEALF